MIVTTQGFSFAMPNGGHVWHKLKDGEITAQCGYRPTGRRGRWVLRLKELGTDGRTCEKCLLRSVL